MLERYTRPAEVFITLVNFGIINVRKWQNYFIVIHIIDCHLLQAIEKTKKISEWLGRTSVSNWHTKSPVVTFGHIYHSVF